MTKFLTLTCLFGALTFASCSGEEETADITSDEAEAAVISVEEATSDAAAEITDSESANAALDGMLDE